MKHVVSIVILVTVLLFSSAPVKAERSGLYGGLLVGGNALNGAKGSDDLGDFGLTFTPAVQGGIVLGWTFEPGNPVGEGRMELEYSHRGNPLDQVKYVEGSVNGGGSVTADSLLVNCFGTSGDAGRFSPYIGLGAGVARVEASGLTVSGQPMGSGSSLVFAYQVGAGFDVALSDRLSLDVGYRFFGTVRPQFTEVNGRPFTMDYYSHSAVVGMRVGF